MTAIRNRPELLRIVRYIVYSQNMRTPCRRLHICLVKCNRKALFSFYVVFLFMLFFQDSDTLKSSDKICRQLIYHLTPHSKWLSKRMTRRKAQAWWEIFPMLYDIKTSESADMEYNLIPSLTVTSHMLNYIYTLYFSFYLKYYKWSIHF